jgi:hypothetical protein
MDKQWTTNKPTVDGWYWIYYKDHQYLPGIKFISCNYLYTVNGRLCISEDFEGYECDPTIYPENITHFIGPLEQPQEPIEDSQQYEIIKKDINDIVKRFNIPYSKTGKSDG